MTEAIVLQVAVAGLSDFKVQGCAEQCFTRNYFSEQLQILYDK